MITGGLLGQPGQGLGTGLLGSLFAGHQFAGGTNDAPAGPAIVGEKGPQLVNLPAHAQVMTNGALQGMMGAGRAPVINLGDSHVHVAGDVSEKNMAAIRQAVAQGQQETLAHVERNLPQIQANAQQSSGAYS